MRPIHTITWLIHISAWHVLTVHGLGDAVGHWYSSVPCGSSQNRPPFLSISNSSCPGRLFSCPARLLHFAHRPPALPRLLPRPCNATGTRSPTSPIPGTWWTLPPPRCLWPPPPCGSTYYAPPRASASASGAAGTSGSCVSECTAPMKVHASAQICAVQYVCRGPTAAAGSCTLIPSCLWPLLVPQVRRVPGLAGRGSLPHTGQRRGGAAGDA